MKTNVLKMIEDYLNISGFFDLKLKLTNEEKIRIMSLCEKVKLKKNEYIIKQGEIERYIYFIERGRFRYWVHNSKKSEMTFWFSFEGEFITPCFFIKSDKSSEFNIQALADSIIWKFKREDFISAYSNYLNINRMAMMILEDALVKKNDREIMLIQNSPEQRYIELMNKSKKIILNIPLKYVASYLGITPQTLSVIRRRIIYQSQ